MSPTSANVQLIYAGGTFGSHGKPLAPLGADVLLPKLQEHIQRTLGLSINVLPNPLVKDSSQLAPSDFFHFYQLILNAYASGQRQFVLITGTDTLSYLAAFLAEAFTGSDISLFVTGSMRPLFNPNILHELIIDHSSDAWDNLQSALRQSDHGRSGVFVTFSQETWPAQTVQKVHSHDLMAFTGHHKAGYPDSSYSSQLPNARRQHWIDDRIAALSILATRATHCHIHALYCVPNSADILNRSISAALQDKATTGIILLGFGSGNIPESDSLKNTLDQAHRLGVLIICASQCPFGGVSDTYAAGSWQYQHHVISGGKLTVAAIYARLLWLSLSQDDASRRRQRWTNNSKQQQIREHRHTS